ncbi:MAG TPA: MopE-related protein [Polyangiaceae bacterium]|nr:MopE-related protein [Polyangiaceae bacterium]
MREPLRALALATLVVACGGVAQTSRSTDDPGGDGGAAGAGGASPNGGSSPSASGGLAEGGGGSGLGGCFPAGPEICNGLDDDCDGRVDEPGTPPDYADGIDFTSPEHCGTCEVDCAQRVRLAWGAKCVPPVTSQLGVSPGDCNYTTCAVNAVDLDGDRSNGCETECPYAVLGHRMDEGGAFCGVDDDCDGQVDEDLCTETDCGACGASCLSGPHTVAECSIGGGQGNSCSLQVVGCSAVTCEDGWMDANGDLTDGCEAQALPPPPPGPESCNGLDDDGDGLIDEPGQYPDGIDGSPDPSDSLRIIGGPCGSDIGECKPGTVACVSGEMKCVGGVRLSTELCDGLDNDCDGHVDNPASVQCGSGFCGTFGGEVACIEHCGANGECPFPEMCRSAVVSGDPAQVQVDACGPRPRD